MGLTSAARLRFLALALAALAVASEARAATSPWARTPEAAVRLVSASEAVGSLDRLRLGLEFELAPGWKTYWRSPGDGGLPPALDWAGSGNLGEASLYWPAPARFTILGIDSVGYEDRVLLPMDVRVPEPGEPVQARLRVDYLTCSDICVPQSADLALALPAGPAQPSAEAFAIDRWRGRTPRPEPVAGRAELVGAGDAAVLHVALPGIEAEDIFVEAGNFAAFGRPMPVAGGLAVPVAYAKGGPEALIGRELVATVTGGGEAVEQRLRVAPAGEAAGYGIAIILALALAGGVILNLMPCVLPVLGIKLMHFAGLGGAGRGRARAEFLAVAGGILFSFWLLAGAAVAATQAGMAVGWGVQFQQPVFLAAMLFLLLLFAANLWGFFEIPAPRFAGGLRGGPFLTGMFATLLATPCSAPFVGTAVGFALTRGPLEIALIFTALGLGLALPYLAVAALPGVAAALPKPGRWTVRLRFVLGLALAGTAVWLLTVLAAQLGWAAAATALAAAALPAGLLAAWARRGGRILAGGAALAAAAGLAAVLVLPASMEPAAPDGRWQAFKEARIGPLVSEGRTVFVDVTADWCITCKFNKAAVLDRGPVAARLTGDLVAMRADWTRPDAAISAYLARFARYGIPFNAVYGPGAPAGIPLPELLTEGAVLEALDEAGRRSGE